MNILAFDTSTAACSVALHLQSSSEKSQTFSVHEICPMQHTSLVLPMIQSVLDKAGIHLQDLHAIAFGCGPGSFTGIRIAASLAQGLAFAQTLPVIPISSLAAAAQSAFIQHGYQQTLVAVDARMDQVYWGAYEVKNGLVSPVIPDEIDIPAAVSQVRQGSWSAIGDGWRVYHEQLVARIGFHPNPTNEDTLPSAAAMLPLAVDRYQRQDWVSAAEALPVYLR